jgi:plastocyanin
MKANDKGIKAQETISEKQESNSNAKDLIVAPQTPTDKVIVESSTLQKDGFLVVRQMDDGQLSQVIEMSQPLKTGMYKNIPINLGSADIANKELIVMIYEDYANDSVFNDLDMPALNENGNMTARYVKTGKPLPSTITEGESVGAMAHNMAGMKSMAKVRYTDKGFTPNKIEVEIGSMVEFINASSMDMWVASVPHPAHSKLPTFDQFRLYKKGAIYRYVFDKKGTWEYHDHINPTAGGVVTVN